MEPDFVHYQGRLVLQVPIEWRYSRFNALMDGDKLVALVGPHQPPESYDFLWDLRGDEETITAVARKQVGEYTMKVATAAAKAAAEKLATVVTYEGKSVLRVPIDYWGNRFVAIADVNLLGLIPDRAPLSPNYNKLGHLLDRFMESAIKEQVLNKLAVKPSVESEVESALQPRPNRQPPSPPSAPLPQHQSQEVTMPEPRKPDKLKRIVGRLLRVVT